MGSVLFTKLLSSLSVYYSQVLNILKTVFSAGPFNSHTVTVLGGLEISYIVSCVCSFIWFLGSYPSIRISSCILTKKEFGFLLMNGENNA